MRLNLHENARHQLSKILLTNSIPTGKYSEQIIHFDKAKERQWKKKHGNDCYGWR